MKSLVILMQKNRVQVQVAALVLLAVALVIPQFAWAGHTPGRPPNVSANPEQIDTAFLAANPEMAAYRRYAADAVQRDTAFLASNPEAVAYRRYVAAQQEIAAATSSARWVALGEYYTNRNASFLASNPEIAAYQRYAAQQDCSDLGLQC